MNVRDKMDALKKKWVQRELSQECREWAKEKGYNDTLSKVISTRFKTIDTAKSSLESTLKNIDQPESLPDVNIAADRIAEAVLRGEVIALETDHDCDGVTSHAVLYEVLVDYLKHPAEKIVSFIGHRLKEGYGLSQSVADRIIAHESKPTLVITADNGTSDEARIAFLKEHNIDTIVTDHHEIPEEGIPESALAVVTPAREDSEYKDKLIAGCMVACLLMVDVRKNLINRGFYKDEYVPPSVIGVFDYVALGTIADCVSMSRSKNNRLVVEHGLKMMNKMNRPCWRAMKVYTGADKELNSESLGFKIGPMINARGRLDDAMAGVNFLLTKDDDEAALLAKMLDDHNNERKSIEKNLKEKALVEAAKQVEEGRLTIVVYLPDGHAGVHGIVASRLTEAYGRPTIIISPKEGEPDIVSASARGVDNFNVRGALQEVDNQYPGILMKFGGHIGAAGLSLKKENIDEFILRYEEVSKQQISSHDVGPVVYSDGEIAAENISLKLVSEFDKLGPYGREMDKPNFESNLYIENMKKIGADKTHLKLRLSSGDKRIEAIWFNSIKETMSLDNFNIREGETRRFLFSIDENKFRGNSTVQLMIKDVA